MARSGGFSANLDPFGTSRGGLGRYNATGDSISSLAATEAYAVAVAWANGAATDEQYVESLRKMVSLETPGDSGYVTAKNKLDDAVYSIGRNKVVDGVNAAITPAARQQALKALLDYDRAHLATMTATDSQAYRTQVERVATTRVDIRQVRYSDMVEKVNRGKATTEQLLALARTLGGEAGADPDADDWHGAILDLNERVADEKLAEGFQAYQHNRKTGVSLLKDIDARMAALTPDSPPWKALKNQREDLAERVKGEARQKAEADMAGKRAAGKVSDKAYLDFRRADYAAQMPGTAEAISSGNQLRDFTFSLAEDKLRFDVQKGTRPPSALISFYETYQRGMNPGSERWRQLQGAIDSLKGGGRSSGGGGGRSGGSGSRSGGSSAGGFAVGPKVLGGPTVLSDLQHGLTTDPMTGKQLAAPPGFGDLFRVNVTDSASRGWWDKNLRSMASAASDGAGSWTFYDKRGREYQLPFVPSLMQNMDELNLAYARAGLASADSAKEAQVWIGRIITAKNSGQSRGARYEMDVYTKLFGDLEQAKQRALAGGRYAEYHNLSMKQLDLAGAILNPGAEPGTIPDVRTATNPFLTADQRSRIANDLAKIAPQNLDDSPANAGNFNPTGDPILAAIRDGVIVTEADHDTGEVIGAEIDPKRGYLTQSAKGGGVTLVTLDFETNPEAFKEDPLTGQMVPRYYTESVRAKVRLAGQDIEVYQPISPAADGTLGGPAFVIDHAFGGGVSASASGGFLGTGKIGNSPARPATYRGIMAPDGTAATVPLMTTFTVESASNGTIMSPRSVRWVSTDGKTWYRWPEGSAVPPRIVIDPSVQMGSDGKWMIDGKAAGVDAVLAKSHVWTGMDALAAGAKDDKDWGIGAPNTRFEMRTTDESGSLDSRPQYIIDSEEAQRFSQRGRAASAAAAEKVATAPYGTSAMLGAMTQWDEPSKHRKQGGAPGAYRPAVEVFGPPAPMGERFGPPSSELLPPALRNRQGGAPGAYHPELRQKDDVYNRVETKNRILAPTAKLLGIKPPALTNVAKQETESLSGAPLPALGLPPLKKVTPAKKVSTKKYGSGEGSSTKTSTTKATTKTTTTKATQTTQKVAGGAFLS